MKIKHIKIPNKFLESKIIRECIKLITYPTWKWCKKYDNWYLYNPKHFYETDETLVRVSEDLVNKVDIPISSEPGDCRFMFVNINALNYSNSRDILKI